MKRIFVIDWILIVVFIVSAISGFGLHVAVHGRRHIAFSYSLKTKDLQRLSA